MRIHAQSLLALFLFPAGPCAQDETPPPAAADVDPAIPVANLEVRLKPFTKAEVEARLAAWLEVLRARAGEVAEKDLEVLAASDRGAQSRASDEASALRVQRDAVIERVDAVIESLRTKGGDVEEAEKYVKSVSGLPPLTGVQQGLLAAKSWLLSVDGGIKLLVNFLQFLGVLLAFRILSKLVARLVGKATTHLGKASDLLRDFLTNTTRKVISFIGLVIALSYLGVNIGPFVAAIGAVGFILGFALQGTLSNFAAGILILVYRPYNIGDYVTAGGVSGTVNSMNLVSTTVKTPDNQTIVVPNGSIWGGVITNVTANPTRRVDMTFGIAYGDDIDKAKRILLELCEEHELILADPAPVVQVGALADSSVNLICRPWAKTGDYWKVFWEMTARVKQRFDREDVSIPFPQRDVHVYQHAVT